VERANPYVGPRAFEENESQYFFGRDQEIEIVASLVMARRVSLLFAQSGAGKSSLLRAGLIPELIRKEEIGRGRRTRSYQKMWVFPILSVGGGVPSQVNRSIRNIFVFNALLSLFPEIDPNSLTQVKLADGLKPFLASADDDLLPQSLKTKEKPPPDTPLLLIFDQFEELFTQHLGYWPKREEFFRQVGDAITVYPSLHILFSMREDYIAELTPYLNLLPEQLRSRFRLERLKRHAALQAIEQPAAKAGRFFDDGVAESLVDNLRRTQVGHHTARHRNGDENAQTNPLETLQINIAAEALGEYVEPVHLQIVLHQLWTNLPPNEVIILAKDVQDFGDVDQALRGFYEQTIGQAVQVTGISERLIRDWFDSQLITPAHTRGLVYRGDDNTEGLPNKAVDLLNDAYLIRANVRGSDVWYELAHDRLVEPILTANRNWQVTYFNPIAVALKEWQDSGQNPRKLLRGTGLKEAREFAARNPQDVFEEERAFLETSVRYLNPLSLATQNWLDSNRNPHELLTGPQLEQASEYVAENPDTITSEEREFLRESLKREEAEQEASRQATRRRRAVMIATVIAILALTALTTWSFNNALDASQQRDAAQQARSTAEMARLGADLLAQTAQANAREAVEQRALADAASTAAIEQQATALAERNSALEAQETAQAASTQAIQQQETAEAERLNADEARAALAGNLEQLLATLEATPTAPPTAALTDTPQQVAAATQATDTPTITPTPTIDRGATATILAVQTQLAAIQATQTVVALEKNMVKVPSGNFLMGSLRDSGGLPGIDRNPEPEEDEFPQRTVFLPAYWIDRTQVTNEEYRRCVESGACRPQTAGNLEYYTEERFDRFPSIYVTWQDAKTYCEWLGKRLPTEAEWEKAARGTDGRIWPWGNRLQDDPTRPVQRANVGDSNTNGLTPVGTFPAGASPYGAADMSGNVWEWINDWYQFDYYRTRPDPDTNPPGPSQEESNGRKVVRGGTYRTVGVDARTAERNALDPSTAYDDVGFRCARTD
jgi:formylglycine-generating enzyme required for sulfatase activity